MESHLLIIIIYLKSIVEFACYIIIGQGLSYLLSFGKQNNNVVYKTFRFLTEPLFNLVKLIFTNLLNEKYIPYLTLFILVLVWLLLTTAKITFANPENFNL